MPDSTETTLAEALGDSKSIGQVLIRGTDDGGFILSHRDDQSSKKGQIFRKSEDAVEIARYDDAGNYRPLKTAPNLRHGWRLEVAGLGELRRALDFLYPGRLGMLAAGQANRLTTTALRDTLNRQSGMYRVAAKITDEQIDDVVGSFCKSDGGCLRSILWKRDARGGSPSAKLPPEKFCPEHDQTGRGERAIPLLCREACNLLVAECRRVVKGETGE
ncbi:MAG TPA: DR2241 family protein [Chthoniobacterales bacterium]|jgi:sirohydrochlorin cobaltochelatase|nr:DR2241 family protein [Chthoniobacterales bacterium]